MSDIEYRIKLYSDIRYNVGLRSPSPISEVPISGSVQYRWSRISDYLPTYALTCHAVPPLFPLRWGALTQISISTDRKNGDTLACAWKWNFANLKKTQIPEDPRILALCWEYEIPLLSPFQLWEVLHHGLDDHTQIREVPAWKVTTLCTPFKST